MRDADRPERAGAAVASHGDEAEDETGDLAPRRAALPVWQARHDHLPDIDTMPTLLGGIGEAFSDRNFRIYSVGSITSWITYFIQVIAFSWATWEITQSTAWLAIVHLLSVGASILFLPLGGVAADRYDRFRLVQGAYALDCLKAAVLAFLAFTDNLGLVAISICAFLHGTIHSFSVPAAYGMIPRFVTRERLAAAIAVNAAYSQFAIFAGPAIAGWILVHGGIAVAFAINVGGYLIYFIAAALLRTPQGYQQPRPESRSLGHDVAAGARYIFGHAGLRAFLVLILVGDAMNAAIYQMMPAYAGLVLGRGVGSVSILYGAAGIGATVAAIWLAQGGAARATPGRVLWAFIGFAGAICLMAGAGGLYVAIAAMLLFGFCGETRRTATISILQSTIDDAQRGRVMATQHFFSQVAGGTGTLLIGFAAQGAGLRLPLLVAASTLVLVWLIVFSRRQRIAAAFAPVTPENSAPES